MSSNTQAVTSLDAIETALKAAGLSIETSEDRGAGVKSIHIPAPMAVRHGVERGEEQGNGHAVRPLAQNGHAIRPARQVRQNGAVHVKASKPTAGQWPSALDETVMFVHELIEALRGAEGNKYQGVHSVLSGFNDCLAAKFGLTERTDVYRLVDGLVAAGAIEKRPCRRGFMIYIVGAMPERKPTQRDGAALLAKLGLA